MEEYFEQLIEFILKHRISDVHFEIKDTILSAQVRTPVKMKVLESNYYSHELIEYLKYQANIDLSNPSEPQSGSFRYYYKGFEYYFRVAYIRTFYTESIVVRVLNKLYIQENLSIFKNQNHIFNSLIQNQNGLIILSGPTGSGKTTSLYNLLHKLKDKKIYTIEDPVEIFFNFLVQLQVNKNRKFGYDEGLKQILRHDPDVIVIGEIRDAIEANMAIRCSLTGHLVITSIHSRSCTTAIQRMLDFGVNRFDLFESLILVSNQRLVSFGSKEGRVAIYEIMEQEDIEIYNNHSGGTRNVFSIEKQIELLSNRYQDKNLQKQK